MEKRIENKALTFSLEGELNSFNSEKVEGEIEQAIAENEGKFDRVVFDFDKLNYISSAGLRIIISVKQRYDDVTIIRVPSDVYDILVMVGFQTLMKVEKK